MGSLVKRAMRTGLLFARHCFMDATSSARGYRRRSFRGQDLHSAELHGTDLRGADFTQANLRGADLSGVRTGRTVGSSLLLAALAVASSIALGLATGRAVAYVRALIESPDGRFGSPPGSSPRSSPRSWSSSCGRGTDARSQRGAVVGGSRSLRSASLPFCSGWEPGGRQRRPSSSSG